MKYMLQIRFNGADVAISNLPTAERAAVFAEFESIRRLPGMLDGNQLQAAGTATTVSVHDGQTEAAEGTAVNRAAALDGYYLYDPPTSTRQSPSPHAFPPPSWARRSRSARLSSGSGELNRSGSR